MLQFLFRKFVDNKHQLNWVGKNLGLYLNLNILLKLDFTKSKSMVLQKRGRISLFTEFYTSFSTYGFEFCGQSDFGKLFSHGSLYHTGRLEASEIEVQLSTAKLTRKPLITGHFFECSFELINYNLAVMF